MAVGFTRDVKLELVTVMPAADHCRRAQLSGLLFGGGVFELRPAATSACASRWGFRPWPVTCSRC